MGLEEAGADREVAALKACVGKETGFKKTPKLTLPKLEKSTNQTQGEKGKGD